MHFINGLLRSLAPRYFVYVVVRHAQVCVHQTDMSLQRLCIEKLGAYLAASDQMLILYSDTYFLKLWTALLREAGHELGLCYTRPGFGI